MQGVRWLMVCVIIQVPELPSTPEQGRIMSVGTDSPSSNYQYAYLPFGSPPPPASLTLQPFRQPDGFYIAQPLIPQPTGYQMPPPAWPPLGCGWPRRPSKPSFERAGIGFAGRAAGAS